MSKLQRVSVLWFLVFVSSLLQGCSEPVDTTTKPKHMLPELRHESIQFIELSSKEGTTQLTQRKEGVWWIEKPTDYQASAPNVDNFIRFLIDLKIGKKLNVASTDLKVLDLDEGGNGLVSVLRYGQNSEKVLKIIFGQFNMPDDTSHGGLLGAGYTARRYMRVIGTGNDGVPTDEVYLAPNTLIDLSASPLGWTDATLIEVPSFKRLALTLNGHIKLELSRDQLFGALYSRNDSGKVIKENPNAATCFEEFIKQGFSYGVGDTDSRLTADEKVYQPSIIVEDFLGVTYRFQFGLPQDPSSHKKEREEMMTGLLNDGVAPTLVPFLLDASTSDDDKNKSVVLNPLEQALKDTNLALVKQHSGRFGYMDLENYTCLTEAAGEYQ